MVAVYRHHAATRRALALIIPAAAVAAAIAAGAHALPLLHHLAVMKPHTSKWW